MNATMGNRKKQIIQAYELHNRNTGVRRMYTGVGIQETASNTDILCKTTIEIQE
jgi:hypothetical protein